MFIFLLFQHRYVFMRLDDFGYASLTYTFAGYNNPHGMDWNLSDLIDFLKCHYFNWGGRVIPYFIAITVFSFGEEFVKIFQSCILFTILLFSYFIVKNKSKDLFATFLIIVAYCALALEPVSDGVFWYMGSAGYVWPLFFLFGGLLLLREFPNQPKYFTAIVILFFLAACSHEQIAVLTIVTIFILNILKFRQTHIVDKTNILILLTVIIGGAIEILAPGNFLRADSSENAAFYQLTLSEKICRNIPVILYIIFNSPLEGSMFVTMIFLAGIKIFPFHEKKFKFRLLFILNVAATLILISSYGIFHNVISEEPAVGLLIFMIIFWAEITFWLIKQENYILSGLFQGAFCSQIMLVMAPYIFSRSVLPFIMIVNLIFAYVFIQSTGQKKFFDVEIYLLTGLIAILAFNNVFEITKGYAGNDFVNRLNRCKLTEYSAKIAAGQKVEAIVLYRLPDDRYSSCMPYQWEPSTLWVKTYFRIPQEIPIIWNKFGELSDIYETVEVQPPKIENISIGEMDLEKGLKIFITPINKGTIPLNVFVNGKKLSTVQNEDLSAFVPRSDLNEVLLVQIKNPITNLTSESMSIYLDKNFVDQYRLK
ncbi:MAG: hypothetical protein IKZ58_08070 [Selenomonadaceae bacterium]|nr:hypothetical protein [Selenomonadaceae bacterium]